MMNRSSVEAAFAFAFASALSFVDRAKTGDKCALTSQERNSISARESPPRCRREGRRTGKAWGTRTHIRGQSATAGRAAFAWMASPDAICLRANWHLESRGL